MELGGRRYSSRRVGESVDLYLLIGIGLVFTVLGVTGVASQSALSAMTIALLAVLAFSQLRERSQVAAIKSAQRSDPADLFVTAFPNDIAERRAGSQDFLHVGLSLARTIQTGRRDFREILSRGGTVRVALLNPLNEDVVRSAELHFQPWKLQGMLRARIEASIKELQAIQTTFPQLEIRVLDFVPRMGINAIDTSTKDGLLCLQHYEHKPEVEALPIFTLERSSGLWYEHFRSEAERIWESGRPWPLPHDQFYSAPNAPAVVTEFEPSITEMLPRARQLFLSGMTRSGFVDHHYSAILTALKNGASLRVLLADPDSVEMDDAVERYYSESTRDRLLAATRVTAAIEMIRECQRTTYGDVEIRLCPHTLLRGVFGYNFDVDNPTQESILFVDSYMFRTLKDESRRTIVTAANEPWFGSTVMELQQHWNASRTV